MLTQEQISFNWERLGRLALHHSGGVREIGTHQEMLEGLEHNIHEGDVTLLGFREAPAAKGNHHAYRGGLVSHLLEMWETWGHLKVLIHESLDPADRHFVSDERVFKAILYHDLHKAHRTYRLVRDDPWETDYSKDDTDSLMTNDTKTLWILGSYGIKLDVQQMNALLWSEGGFSKNQPYHCSVLAKLAYLLDEMSGNVLARIHSRTFLSHRRAEP